MSVTHKVIDNRTNEILYKGSQPKCKIWFAKFCDCFENTSNTWNYSIKNI